MVPVGSGAFKFGCEAHDSWQLRAQRSRHERQQIRRWKCEGSVQCIPCYRSHSAADLFSFWRPCVVGDMPPKKKAAAKKAKHEETWVGRMLKALGTPA